MTGLYTIAIALLAMPFSQTAPQRITAAEAKSHIGEAATVCGTVVDSKISKYSLGGRGRPVTLDLDQPEPNPVFFFVTFGADRAKPEQVESTYKGKQVCVTGKIENSDNRPFIMASEPSQIKIQPAKK